MDYFSGQLKKPFIYFSPLNPLPFSAEAATRRRRRGLIDIQDVNQTPFRGKGAIRDFFNSPNIKIPRQNDHCLGVLIIV